MNIECSEVSLRRDIKARVLGLATMEKLRVKQQSRLNSIRASEANTKLFYLQASLNRGEAQVLTADKL